MVLPCCKPQKKFRIRNGTIRVLLKPIPLDTRNRIAMEDAPYTQKRIKVFLVENFLSTKFASRVPTAVPIPMGSSSASFRSLEPSR